jgi:hypothetical protein
MSPRAVGKRAVGANHLRTDSRVLRRTRPFDTSINAFGANFFLRRGVDCAGVVACKKFSREISLLRRILSPQQKL